MAKKEKSSGFSVKLNSVAVYLSDFGRYICLIVAGIAVRLGRAAAALWRYIGKKTGNFNSEVFAKLKYAWFLFLSPFLKLIQASRKAKEDVSEHKTNKGVFAAIKAAFSHIGEFIFGKSGVAVTIFNIAAPVISIAFLFNIVSYASNLSYCVKLTVNNKFLGYVENEQVFYDADEILKQRINYLGSDENIELTPSFSIELSGGNDLLTKYQVADKMLEYSDISVEYAYGFYLNGVFQGAIPDAAPVLETLDGILAKYRELYPDADIEFRDTMDCSTAGLYLSGSLIDTDWLISQLTSVKTKAGYYIAEEGDTKESICEKLNLTESQLEHLNPGFSGMTIYAGDRIKIREEIPFLSVNVKVVEEYDVVIPYETEYYNEPTLYSGVTQVTTEGADGANHIVARVTYVNSIELDRRIISSKNTAQPVTKRIAMGTKIPPEQYSPQEAGYGKFIWPTDGGYISEYTYWDGGYSGHAGVDIVSSGYGAPVYAGGSGTVVFAGSDYSGYGNYIIIDHGNGYQTLYAHCSALYVSVGQQVTQGELIAAMGQTGMAYGVHLHFEVRQGGIKLNPVNFLEHYR